MRRWLITELRRLDPLTVLVVALGAAMAVLSWDGLRAAALATGAVHHETLAIVWAGSVDALWIAAALAVRRAAASLRHGVSPGRIVRLIVTALVLLIGLAGSAMQVWYPPTWAARLMPPVGLGLTLLLEMCVVRLRVSQPEPAVETQARRDTHPERGDRPMAAGSALSPGAQPPAAPAPEPIVSLPVSQDAPPAARLDRALAGPEPDGGWTSTKLAHETGVSRGHAGRRLKVYRARETAVSQNGSG